MKLRLILTFMIALLAFPVSAGKPQGKIVFERTECNFGTFKRTTVKYYTFKFKNVGNAPVVIQSTSTACACTAAVHSRQLVKPGETGTVTVYYNPTKTASRGKFRKSIDVRSNAENSVVRLFISGETR